MMTVRRIKLAPRGQAGLTLLETIVAIVVLGFGMAALASIYPLFQSLDDIDDADRFARKAQGCAELILAAYRVQGEDAFDFSGSPTPCHGNLNQPIANMEEVLDPGMDPDGEGVIARYCAYDPDDHSGYAIQVACKHETDYTVFKISRDAERGEVSPIYLGLPVSN